jgi:hypothetical protein
MRVALNTADAHLLAVRLFQMQLPRGRTTHNPELSMLGSVIALLHSRC